MAEVVVNYVLGKITEAAYKEAILQYGAGNKVEWAKRELKWVSAFLEDADAKQNKNARVRQWVEEVKEVAYMIEDALDKFLVEMGGGRQKKGTLRQAIHMPKACIARHKVGTEIDSIKERMKEIRENREQLGILSLESSSEGSAKKLVGRPVVVPEIDKTEVVGFEDDVKNICEELLHQSVSRRSVVSIVAPGGRGKTTIATKIYNSGEVERHFDRRIWVTVSQEFNMTDVLKKMLKKLRGDIANVGDDEEDLVRELHESLSNKRYLVVLDDVWSTENRNASLWARLEKALPDDHNWSRVLITTRFISVATESDAVNKPYQLRTLSKDESQQLLLKKVFPNQFANQCPDNLLPLIYQFAQKCGGWPLALVVLGGILSTKDPNTWNEFMLKMEWQIEGRECLDNVSFSYEDLPSHLKPCFMYFAAFPQDYQIKASTLIQLWIVEGVARQESKKNLEDMAENYLEELVQRCMVQVSRRSWSGRIKYCYVHDILHELAIRNAQQDNFLLVCSKSTETSIFETNTPSTRRLSFHKFGESDKLAIEQFGPNLRTLISFGGFLPDSNHDRRTLSSCFSNNNNKPRMVRVVHLGNDSGKLDPKWKCLKHQTTLRYYHRDRCYHELPTSFWNNKMLRHVKIMRYNKFVFGPPSWVNLENLVTLKGVVAREEWIAKFPNIPRIRKLGFAIYADIDWEALTNSMSRLEHLHSLHILFYARFLGQQYCLIPTFKNYKQMHSLYLCGRWPEKVVSDWSLFPPNLAKLMLEYSVLEQDPMPELAKLPNLRALGLLKISYEGGRLVCSTGGFKCLQRLKLQDLYMLEELKVEEGAMPMLSLLELSWCTRLKMVPDLQHLTSLRELNLDGMPKEFDSRLKEAEQHKVKHIPSIIIGKPWP